MHYSLRTSLLPFNFLIKIFVPLHHIIPHQRIWLTMRSGRTETGRRAGGIPDSLNRVISIQAWGIPDTLNRSQVFKHRTEIWPELEKGNKKKIIAPKWAKK